MILTLFSNSYPINLAKSTTINYQINSIFPHPIIIPVHIQQLLQAIYPTIRWEKVRMYEGLPWFVAQWTSALVLPNIWRKKMVHIYFRKIDTTTLKGLSVLVHECFHVLQYQDSQKKYEMGMFRVFLLHYIAYYLEGFVKHIRQYSFAQASQKAYYNHPLEIPAYRQDSLMTQAGSSFLYREKTFDLLQNSEVLTAFIEKNPTLVKYSSGILNDSPSFLSKITSFLICSILLFINPFLELLLKIIFCFYFIFSKKKHSFVL